MHWNNGQGLLKGKIKLFKTFIFIVYAITVVSAFSPFPHLHPGKGKTFTKEIVYLGHDYPSWPAQLGIYGQIILRGYFQLDLSQHLFFDHTISVPWFGSQTRGQLTLFFLALSTWKIVSEWMNEWRNENTGVCERDVVQRAGLVNKYLLKHIAVHAG